MNILCLIFGHKPPSYGAHKGFGGYDYASLRGCGVDGLNQEHFHVVGECPRCEKDYDVCRISRPAREPQP